MSRFAIATRFMLVVAALPAHASVVEVMVRDAAGQPVAEAAVFATPASGTSDARPGRSVEVQQVDREFAPLVTVVQTGTAVTFPNQDPILHHVYSFSPAKPFEIKLYAGRSPTEVLFDKPGVVTLGCNIHDWMIGYIVVVATPFFTKSDANGVARLRDLPAGRYELRSWHPQQRAQPAAQVLLVDGAGVARTNVAFDLAPRKAKFKPPLDRMKY